jgi:CBS domain-containing protein
MLVNVVLRNKGATVVTVPSDASVRRLLDVLAEHSIGAVVVSGDGRSVDGIVSERDVVRHLRDAGKALLDAPVASIMTADVVTCTPRTTVDELMALMTQRRIRHVPVMDDDALAGIVSIGDVVKSRITELESEREDLITYIGSH